MKKIFVCLLMALTIIQSVNSAHANPWVVRAIIRVLAGALVSTAIEASAKAAVSSTESHGGGGWHRNKHGFYSYSDGKRLNLGIGCDVIFRKVGRGKWYVKSNGEVTVKLDNGQVFKFHDHSILNAHQSKECRI